MADCGSCLKSMKNVKSKIMCNDCKKPFHGRCVNLSPEDINFLNNENEIWRCDPCGKVRRKSMVMESATKSVTYEDIMKLLREMKSELKRVEEGLGKSIESCHDQIKENTKITKEGNEEVAALKDTVVKLMEENTSLKKRVAYLEEKVDDMDQYSRVNCLEIHGIPEVSGRETAAETLVLVKKLGDAVGFPISDAMVDNCHRLKKRPGNKPAGIIVKMVRRLDSEALLQKKREKRDLSTRHLNLPQDIPIWINESLSQRRRQLLFHAREVKIKKGYKYLWIRGGKILLRKSDGEKVQVISSYEHLELL